MDLDYVSMIASAGAGISAYMVGRYIEGNSLFKNYTAIAGAAGTTLVYSKFVGPPLYFQVQGMLGDQLKIEGVNVGRLAVSGSSGAVAYIVANMIGGDPAFKNYTALAGAAAGAIVYDKFLKEPIHDAIKPMFGFMNTEDEVVSTTSESLY